jgi:DNA-binding transcriptional MerR regulator
MEAMLQIGQLAERVGVSTKAIRYYEQVGLLAKPTRSEGGYRLYATDDEERLRFISTARRTGFTRASAPSCTLASRELENADVEQTTERTPPIARRARRSTPKNLLVHHPRPHATSGAALHGSPATAKGSVGKRTDGALASLELDQRLLGPRRGGN